MLFRHQAKGSGVVFHFGERIYLHSTAVLADMKNDSRPPATTPTASAHVVFAGGGTAGHLFPGLAVAGCLAGRRPDLRITFAGTGREFEKREVAAAGFGYLALPCRPLPRRLREIVPFLADNLAGYRAAAALVKARHVAAVVGLGGYASAATAWAAARRGIPLVLLEQNIIPGRATRWLAPRASLVCTAFERTAAYLRACCPVRATGNPIRPGFAPRPDTGRDCSNDTQPAERQLVVLGGSAGARALNENVPRALGRIRPRLGGWRVVHQSGAAECDATRQRYRDLGLPATVVPFAPDMAGLLRGSHLAVSRAGGTTLAELAAAGVPAVLVPYPHAADDHQRINAEALAAEGGCVVLDERKHSGKLDHALADVLSGLLADPGAAAIMAASMRRLARPDAAQHVAELVEALVSESRGASVLFSPPLVAGLVGGRTRAASGAATRKWRCFSEDQ